MAAKSWGTVLGGGALPRGNNVSIAGSARIDVPAVFWVRVAVFDLTRSCATGTIVGVGAAVVKDVLVPGTDRGEVCLL